MLARPDAFMSAISERLLTYALGRELDHHDGPAVRRIMQQAADQDFTFTALVQAVVTSAPFQQRIKLATEEVAAATAQR